jgi:hypothetical protein
MRVYAEQIETLIKPTLEKLDMPSLIKWVQASLDFRYFTHIFSILVYSLTQKGKDGKGGMNVTDETTQFWKFFLILDVLGFPADIFYSLMINSSKNGRT